MISTIDRAIETISDVVNSLAQTTVDVLKEDEKWTDEKGTEVFNKAKKEVLSILTYEAKEALREVYDDVDKRLNNRIESEVLNLKIKRANTGERA